MKHKKCLNWVYGISALLIIAGVVMDVFMGIKFGNLILYAGFIFGSLYQSWVIAKLEKQLKDRE